MSLTSYRTAPPRVTDLRSASDTPTIPLIIPGPQTKLPAPTNDFAAHSGRRGRGPPQPAEPRSSHPGGCKNLEGGPALKEQLFTVGLADLAATYSPVP